MDEVVREARDKGYVEATLQCVVGCQISNSHSSRPVWFLPGRQPHQLSYPGICSRYSQDCYDSARQKALVEKVAIRPKICLPF